MAQFDRQRLERIDTILDKAVKPARWPATSPVEIRANHLHGEPISYAEATSGSFEPFEVGDAWGPLWDTTWFRVAGTVPSNWAGHRCALVVHLGYGGASGFGARRFGSRDGCNGFWQRTSADS